MRKTKIAAVLVVIALLVCAQRLGVFEQFGDPEHVRQTLVQLGPWGYLAFVLTYAALQPFGVPGTVFGRTFYNQRTYGQGGLLRAAHTGRTFLPRPSPRFRQTMVREDGSDNEFSAAADANAKVDVEASLKKAVWSTSITFIDEKGRGTVAGFGLG